MIYPDFRQSELEQEVEEKRTAFIHSKENLTQIIERKIRPASLIKDNKKYIAGFLLTLISAGKFMGKMNKSMGKINHNGSMQMASGGGWTSKLMFMAGILFTKFFSSMVRGTGQMVLKRALKSFLS